MIPIQNSLQNELKTIISIYTKGKVKQSLDNFISKTEKITQYKQDQYLNEFPTSALFDLALLVCEQKKQLGLSAIINILQRLFEYKLIKHLQDYLKILYLANCRSSPDLQLKIIQGLHSTLDPKIIKQMKKQQSLQLIQLGFKLYDIGKGMTQNIIQNFLIRFSQIYPQVIGQDYGFIFEIIFFLLFRINNKQTKPLLQIINSSKKGYSQILFRMLDSWASYPSPQHPAYKNCFNFLQQHFHKNNKIIQFNFIRLIFKAIRNMHVDINIFKVIDKAYQQCGKDSITAACICQGIAYLFQNCNCVHRMSKYLFENGSALQQAVGIARIRAQQFYMQLKQLLTQQQRVIAFSMNPTKLTPISINSYSSFIILKDIVQNLKQSLDQLQRNKQPDFILLIKSIYKPVSQIYRFLVPATNNESVIKQLLNGIQWLIIISGRCGLVQMRDCLLGLLMHLCQKIQKKDLQVAGIQAARIIFNILYGYEEILDKEAYKIILGAIYDLQQTYHKNSKPLSQYFIIKDLSARLFVTAQVSQTKSYLILQALQQLIHKKQGNDIGSYIFRVIKPILQKNPGIYKKFIKIVQSILQKKIPTNIILSQINNLVLAFWDGPINKQQLLSFYKLIIINTCQNSQFFCNIIQNYQVQDTDISLIISLNHQNFFKIIQSICSGPIFQIKSTKTLLQITQIANSLECKNRNQLYLLINCIWTIADRLNKTTGQHQLVWEVILSFLNRTIFQGHNQARNSALHILSQIITLHYEQIKGLQQKVVSILIRIIKHSKEQIQKDYNSQGQWVDTLRANFKGIISCYKFFNHKQQILKICQDVILWLCQIQIREFAFEGTQALCKFNKLIQLNKWPQKQRAIILLKALLDNQKFGKQSRSYVRNKIRPNVLQIIKLQQ